MISDFNGKIADFSHDRRRSVLPVLECDGHLQEQFTPSPFRLTQPNYQSQINSGISEISEDYSDQPEYVDLILSSRL